MSRIFDKGWVIFGKDRLFLERKRLDLTMGSPYIARLHMAWGTLKCVLAQGAMRVVHLGQNVVERPCKIYVYKSNRYGTQM